VLPGRWIDVRANGMRRGGDPAAAERGNVVPAGLIEESSVISRTRQRAADRRRLSDVMGVTARPRSGRLRQICSTETAKFI